MSASLSKAESTIMGMPWVSLSAFKISQISKPPRCGINRSKRMIFGLKALILETASLESEVESASKPDKTKSFSRLSSTTKSSSTTIIFFLSDTNNPLSSAHHIYLKNRQEHCRHDESYH